MRVFARHGQVEVTRRFDRMVGLLRAVSLARAFPAAFFLPSLIISSGFCDIDFSILRVPFEAVTHALELIS